MLIDLDAILGQNIDGELSTKTDPLPADDWIARIDKVEARKLDGKDGKDDRVILTVFWAITESDKLMALDPPRDSFTVRQDIWLDLDSRGAVATGKGQNIGLGRLYEALGMNEGSRNIRSLAGNVAVIKTGVRANKEKPEDLYTEVKAVSPLT